MRTIAIAMVLVAILASAVAADEGVRLLYTFESGQTLDYEMTMAGSGLTTVTPEGSQEPEQSVPVELEGVMTMTQRVVQMYDDGSALLGIIVNALEMDMTVEQGGEPQHMHMEFTPDKLIVTGPQGTHELSLSEGGMPGAPLGAPMKIRMSPRGEILAAFSQGLEQLSAVTGMDLSNMLKPGETPFPDRELSPGDTWSYELEIPTPAQGQTIKMDMTGTLLRLDEEATATIGLEGDIDLSGMTMEAPAGAGTPGTKLTFDTLKEQLSGAFEFDIERGVMTEAGYSIVVSTAMKPPAGPGQPPSMVKSEMTMRMEMKLK